MARICQNCGKGVMHGCQVARARQELTYRSPKVFKPNLHKARIKQVDGSKIKMLLCTKCLRMMKKYMAQQLSEQEAKKSSAKKTSKK